jgi:hypothetical protein
MDAVEEGLFFFCIDLEREKCSSVLNAWQTFWDIVTTTV